MKQRIATLALALTAAWASPSHALDTGGRLTPPRVEGVVNRGSGPFIALTFDACPRPKGAKDYDEAVISVLRAEKVPATLFISGVWAQKHPEIVKNLAADRLFEVGAHGHRHERMVGLTQAKSRADLARAQSVLQRLGVQAKVWRPPYGDVDTAAVHAAESLGLTTINFSLASGDPDKNISTARLIRGVVENARAGSIIVMHMNGNGPHTAEALPGIIAGLRKRGFTFVHAGTFAAKAIHVAAGQ